MKVSFKSKNGQSRRRGIREATAEISSSGLCVWTCASFESVMTPFVCVCVSQKGRDRHGSTPSCGAEHGSTRGQTQYSFYFLFFGLSTSAHEDSLSSEVVRLRVYSFSVFHIFSNSGFSLSQVLKHSVLLQFPRFINSCYSFSCVGSLHDINAERNVVDGTVAYLRDKSVWPRFPFVPFWWRVDDCSTSNFSCWHDSSVYFFFFWTLTVVVSARIDDCSTSLSCCSVFIESTECVAFSLFSFLCFAPSLFLCDHSFIIWCNSEHCAERHREATPDSHRDADLSGQAESELFFWV